MANFYYRDPQLEQALLHKINAAANMWYGGDIPAGAQERIDMETRYVFSNSNGTLLAAAASLAELSAAQGYPVGIQGLVGNLLIAHLLGLGAVNPVELGLPWENCLGPDGNRMPGITLNVARELLNDLRAHLREIFPDCDVLFGIGTPSDKTVIVPRVSGVYDRDNEYLILDLQPHKLMSRLGKVRWQDDPVSFDEDLIISAYRTDVGDIPVLSDTNEFQDLANMLAPKTFPDLVKVLGLCRARKIMLQAYRTPLLPDRFDHLAGTQEDIYDICVQNGIDRNDAFLIMRQAVRGKLAARYKDILAARGLPAAFLEMLDDAKYLYPRGQCADYLYWALTLLALEHRSCRV